MEFGNDLRASTVIVRRPPGVTIIGVSDDAFARTASVTPHLDRAWPDEHLAVVSAFGAGKPGTPEHQERLYRLLLRAVSLAHFGIPPSHDPTSLLFEGMVTPAELDGKALPKLGR